MSESDYLDLEEGGGDNEASRTRCFLGRIVSDKTLNKIAVTNILHKAWNTRAEFSITPWSHNTTLFRFNDEEDRRSILRDAPWSVIGNLLVLKPLPEGVVASEMDFNTSPFWVQIHGLPVEKMTKVNAEIIGKRFACLLGIEAVSDGLLLQRSFLRVRVEVNISQPLPKGFWMRRKNPTGTDLWISYKYERLSDFCFACGRLGHENKNCKFVTREEGLSSGYGPELRTGSIRGPGLPMVDMESRVISSDPDHWPLGIERGLVARDQERVAPRVEPPRREDAGTGTEIEREQQSTNLLELDVASILTPGVVSVLAPGTKKSPSKLNVIPKLSPLNIPFYEGMGSLEPRGMTPNSPNDSASSNSRSGGPMYFVTEPGDSPKKANHPISPSCFGPFDPLNETGSLSPIQPNPTITALIQKLSPAHGHEDIILFDIFDRLLSIKRKINDSPTFLTKSKALKLDNHSYLPIIPIPELTPSLSITHPYNTRATIKKHFVPKKRNPIPESSTVLLGSNVDGSLVDVRIIQVNEDGKNSFVDVCQGIPTVGSESFASKTKGRWWLALNSHTLNADFGLEFGLSGGLALWWTANVSLFVEYASNNVVHTSCESLLNSKKLAMSFVYGSPTIQQKEAVWDQIRDIAFSIEGPWFCLGDFNDIAVAKEKFGGRSPSCSRISAFNDFLNDCALIDLGFKGHPFTWRNNRVGLEAVMGRLDKAFANIEGRQAFPQAMVFHDSAIGSDHCPIRLNLEEPLKIYRPFRFESMWTVEEDCEGIVKANWGSGGGNCNASTVVQKLDRCKRDLQAWHKGKFSKMKDQIATLKCKIEALQGGPISLASKLEEEQLTAKLNKLWEQKEMYWHQRARLNYMKFGDKHSKFFHITATQRRQRNLILRLKNEKEDWINSPRALSWSSNKISAEANANLCRSCDEPPLTVGDLLRDGGRGWNEEKIDSLFPPEMGNAIKSTPISWSGGEDKLIWAHSSSGNYSVKSGYHLAFQSTQENDTGQDSSSSKLSSTLWKKIWNLGSPPRLKHFLWRIIRNAVSTKENLFTRKCARSPMCGLCGAEIETIEHVLLRCEWTKEVWANSGIEFTTPVNRVVNVKKWFVSLLVEWGGQFSERMGLIAQICWAIWKQRNEWVFMQQKPNARVTLKRALGFHGEFLAAACSQINVPACNHGDSNVPKWQRPLNGSWKFNCDGAFNPSDKSAAFAVLVRDENGSVVEINHGRIRVSSALTAEAWAIRIAVSMALAWEKKDAIIESDCQPLVNMLQPESIALTEKSAETYKDKGIGFYSMHPGWAETPGVANSLPGFSKSICERKEETASEAIFLLSLYKCKIQAQPWCTRKKSFLRNFIYRLSGKLRTSEQGADTVIWLALMRKERLLSGAFYFDRVEAPKHLKFAATGGSHAAAMDSIINNLRSLSSLSSYNETQQ
ncbi:hypothetical protein RHSIM_Rhsim06G0091800 [Rhododendron simsii]|uniref:CCHC-type domain-containing protein n=1 Tax=Rhododendron simsii TaxID=118357 RepID=A0A834LKD0_RHOSS|nr:hypothetical protein RHSIM_Rhsim06G0091800 [Rhododendron simsii]